MTKKLMALLLAVLMAVSLLPMPAMADDAAAAITDITKITEAAGSYVLDKNNTPKVITLDASLVIDKDVTLELTGQTVTLASAEGENASVFRVESGSLTLKGTGTVKAPGSAAGILVQGAALKISGDVSVLVD